MAEQLPTSTILQSTISVGEKKVPYFLLPHLVFWVAEKKEATSWRIDPKEPDQ